MTFTSSYKIIIRDDVLRQDGTALVCLQAFINKKRVVISLQIYVKPVNFDKASQSIVSDKSGSISRKDLEGLNLIIGRAKAKANDIFIWHRLNETNLSPEAFKKAFIDETGRMDFLAFFEKSIIELTGTRELATVRGYKYCLSKIRKFRPRLSFKDLNTDFIMQFDKFLQVTEKININSRWKYHKVIKSIINYGLKKGLPLNNPYVNFKIKKGQSSRAYLTIEELNKLMQLYNSQELNPHTQNVLEYFLFSCYTGLRISDIEQITSDMIVGDFLVFMPRKTRTTLKISKLPLNELALQIVKGKTGKLFNVCYRTNIWLKSIARACDIPKNLSFHVARHTFATLFLEAGGSVEVLKEILGQSKIETTMVYVHITNNRKTDQMTELSKFITTSGKKSLK